MKQKNRQIHINYWKLLVAALVLTATAARTFAADSAPANTSEAAPAKKEEKKPWAVELEYMATTDLADEVRPRIFRHDVMATASYDVKDWFTTGVEVDYFFKTVGGAYSRYREDSGVYSVTPFVTKKVYEFKGLGGNHKIIGMLHGDIPTNEEARIEGYTGSVGAMPMLISTYFDGLISIKNRLMYNHLFNRYSYNPTTFEPASTDSYGYDIGSSVRVIGGLRAGVGFGLRRTRYADRFHDFSYKNTQTLSYAWSSWSFAVKHTNGGYTEDGHVELWYRDQYRRMFSGIIGYEF